MDIDSKHQESARKLNRRLGKILKAKRISKGLSKAEVAMGSRLSLEMITTVERGEGLNLDDLVMIAKVLKTSLTDLFVEAGL